MLLANLLHLPELQELHFEPAVIHLFVVFFSHRLSDYPSIVPSLHALQALIKYHAESFNSKYSDVLDIFQTVFREIDVGSLAQTIRQKVFDLFLAILSSECVKSQGNDIADKKSHNIDLFGSEAVCLEIFTGLVVSMEGEKDPRCLVAALKSLELGIKHFSFLFDNSTESTGTPVFTGGPSPSDGIMEKLFDSVACYFPITFSPPEDDPFGVTTESLIQSLENVLCAHSALHKHVLPFLVDHLTDETTLGRVQATSLLARLGTFEEYSPKIFRYIVQEDSENNDGKENKNSILVSIAERYENQFKKVLKSFRNENSLILILKKWGTRYYSYTDFIVKRKAFFLFSLSFEHTFSFAIFVFDSVSYHLYFLLQSLID
jgi:Dos2-interacting transcription regulator of RNA-Pol-II